MEALLFFIALTLAMGCGDTRQMADPWPTTSAACASLPPFSESYPPELADYDVSCIEALQADFGLDETGFEPDALQTLYSALSALLRRDAGPVHDLDQTAYVRDPLLRELRRASRAVDTDDLRQLLYDYSAHHIDAMVWMPEAARDGTTNARFDDGVVWVDPDLFDVFAMGSSTLFHEATHAVTVGHVQCDPAIGGTCDLGWNGAYGLEVGVDARWYEHCDWELSGIDCLELLDELAQNRTRVMAP